ncbi:unnamed protein product [Prunus armeniaca]
MALTVEDIHKIIMVGKLRKAKSAVREGRTFNEVARGIRIDDEVSSLIPKVYFKEVGPSGVDKGNNVLSNPSLSQEENSISALTTFKSPKKRARELFEEV